MECNTKSVYDSLEMCPGQRAMPGIRRRVYYIHKMDIADWPALPRPGDDGKTMKDLSVYDGDFALKQDKFFKFLDLKDEASNVTFEPVGDNIGSKLFNNRANLVATGMSDEIKGFSAQALNDDIVYVYQQRDGKFCVLGHEAFSCNTGPTGDSGTAPTDAITVSLGIQCYDECPVPTYVGKLFLSSTTYIDCSDGKEKAILDTPGGGEG